MKHEQELREYMDLLNDPSLIFSPERLRSALKIRGYSYEEFSHRSGISITLIGNLCNGKSFMNPSKLALISTCLDCSPNDLFIPADIDPASQERVFDNKRFKQALSKRGITNQELAIKIGCHPNTIGYWNQGKNKKNPNLYFLALAANELGESLESFFVRRGESIE